MANNISALAGLDKLNGTPGSSSSQKVRKKDEMGQNEFLTLLVTQLKHQDPMDPSNPEEFAVNLAQFTQVEQLTQINQKLASSSSGSEMGYLTGYLGKKVTLDSDIAHVVGHDAGYLELDLPSDAASVSVQLVSADGGVVEQHTVGGLSAGKHSIRMSGLDTEAGDYQVKVNAVSSAGMDLKVSALIAGVVTGIIPGPQPSLLVNGREIAPTDIREVGLAE